MKQLPTDPVILELLPEFIDTWIVDINEQFTPLCEAKDKDNFYRLAHTLKGSGFQFGIDNVGNMGLEMMRLTKEEKWEELPQFKELLLKEFEETKKLLNNSN